MADFKFGLINLGNTCFFNAALQSLLSVEEFNNYILNIDDWKIYLLNNNNNIPVNNLLMVELYKLLKNVKLIEHNNIFNPITLFESIQKHSRIYNGQLEYPYIEFSIGIQSDSFDILNAIIGTLHDEIVQKNNRIDIDNEIFTKLHSIYHDFDIDRIDIPYNYEELLYFNYRFIQRNYTNEYSTIQALFTSFIINTTECLHCGDKTFGLMQTNVYEVDLLTPFIHNTTLECREEPHSLIEYMKNQLSDSTYTDSHAHKKTTGHIQCCTYHKFWRIPTILIIRLKRFEYINGIKRKLNYPIIIPEIFDIKPFIHRFALNERCNSSTIYKLCATVQHRGGCEGGHYFTYGLRNNTWYEFNDSSVSKIIPDHSQSYYVIYSMI